MADELVHLVGIRVVLVLFHYDRKALADVHVGGVEPRAHLACVLPQDGGDQHAGQ